MQFGKVLLQAKKKAKLNRNNLHNFPKHKICWQQIKPGNRFKKVDVAQDIPAESWITRVCDVNVCDYQHMFVNYGLY